MTDGKILCYTENDFPALDNNSNNINNSTNNLSIPSSSNSSTTNANTVSSNKNWSTGSSQTQTKLNYHLLLTNSQQIQLYQQQPQQSSQQVLDHLVDSDHALSHYHLHNQPQSVLNQSIANNSTNNNNNNILNNSSIMQNNPSNQQPKRPGLPNPITSSERCCTFKIAPEERRHRDFELEQSKILKEIMQKTNTKIEVTTTKDGALNFCIIGKEQFLKLAKNLVLNDFQTSVTLTVSVPKSIHGRLLGPKGQRLASIQDETQTKIAIPRKEEDSDIIKIVGLKSNAEMAVRSIQKYVREFACKTVEKVSVERTYLLFITGPFNENLKRWEELGVKVTTSGGILPSNNEKETGHADEIVFTILGETAAVNQVKEEIVQIYEDKKKKCTTVNIEVKKAQHKYILGPGGQNLRNLFAKTGVSVELPHESESETITLRGERSKLGPALSELYQQAHSETDEFLEVENWLHKYLIGVRKTNYIDFKARGVDAKSLDDKIRLHGPPTEVENIRDILEAELENVRATIIRKDIRVEPRIHGYIIGKAGATVDQIREESGAFVLVPKNDESSEYITLEGTTEAVAIAEDKINSIAKKYEASRKLVVDQQLHGSIIGRGGEKIRSIREKFSQIVFTFPEQGSKNNEITILGPTDEVEECYKYLDEFHKQLQESNYQAEVPIKSDVIKYLPDAQPAIKRIKLDHRVKIDVHINNPDTKEASTKQPQQKQANNNNNNKVNEQSLLENVSNPENSEGKKKANKSKANKKQPQQPDPKQSDQTVTTGNKGADSKRSENFAVVIGKKEDVEQAKVKVSKLFDELSTTTEFEVKISHKLRPLLGPNTKPHRQLLDDFQNKVIIVFPQQKREKNNKQSSSGGDEVTNQSSETNGAVNENNSNNKKDNRIDIVKIRGPKNIAKKAEKSFEALVAECQERLDKNYQAQVSVDTAIVDKFMAQDKVKLNKIRESQSVKLNIPDRRDTFQLTCSIVGYEKNVQAALQQFNKLIKEVEERQEETIEIPSQFHPRLIGAQGRNVKKIMEDFKVGVKFARQGDPNPNSVVLYGRPNCILAAKNHMMKLAHQYLSSAGRGNNNNLANSNISGVSNNNSQQQQSEVSGIGNAE